MFRYHRAAYFTDMTPRLAVTCTLHVTATFVTPALYRCLLGARKKSRLKKCIRYAPFKVDVLKRLPWRLNETPYPWSSRYTARQCSHLSNLAYADSKYSQELERTRSAIMTMAIPRKRLSRSRDVESGSMVT